MRPYVLVSDSTADLPVEVIKKYDIKIIPFSYSIDDEIFHYYLDERDGDIGEFYTRLKNGDMPVTSQVNPVVYKEFFEEFVKAGKDVLYIAFSSGLSGSYRASLLGVELLKESYPDAKVEVIDSLAASIGQGVFVFEAAKLKYEGMSMDALELWIRDRCTKVRHWFMVEDLFHLKRGGRITAVEAVVGSALKIKPILSVDEDGKLVVKAKTRGIGKALEYITSRVVEEGQELENLVAVIGHADAIDKANRLKDMVIAAGMKAENIQIAPIGPIIGTHVGAGMTAIAFVPKL